MTNLNLSQEQFLELDYKSRVVWFDKTFQIIQYQFPPVDTEISWYFDEAETMKLVNIYNHEMQHHGMSRRGTDERGEPYKFDIRPSTRQQRIFLNEYLLSQFLKTNRLVYTAFDILASSAFDKMKFLNTRIDKLLTTIDWLTIELGMKQKITLKRKFLSIIYSGYMAFKTKSDKMITKRKLTELFLFSQGILIAEILHLIETNILNEVKDEGQGIRHFE